MVDPLSQQIIQDIGSASVTQSSQPSVVSPQDAASFQNMMQGDVQEVAGVQSVETPTATQGQDFFQAPAPEKKLSLGDRILQGLENSQNNIQTARDNIAAEIQGDGSINKMYELQLQVSQLATSQQILGQVGSKTSQGIQTLLKGQ